MAVRPRSTIRRALLLGLAALLVLAPAVAAQVADPAVSVSLETTTLDLGAGNTTSVLATVTNGNPNVAGNVVVALAAPNGWIVDANTLQFPLEAGASQEVVLTLTAPEAGAGAATGAVALTATLTESAATGRTAAATASLSASRVDPIIPPLPVPWYATTAGILGIAGVALAVAGLVALLILRQRRYRRAVAAADAARAEYLSRETGIEVELVDPPRQFGPKREFALRLAVRNASDRPRVAVVRLDVPEGWRGTPALPRLPLSPGERVVMSACISAPPDVPVGSSFKTVLVARPEEAQERDERVELTLEIPLARLTAENGRIVSGPTLRATANQRLRQGVNR